MLLNRFSAQSRKSWAASGINSSSSAVMGKIDLAVDSGGFMYSAIGPSTYTGMSSSARRKSLTRLRSNESRRGASNAELVIAVRSDKLPHDAAQPAAIHRRTI